MMSIKKTVGFWGIALAVGFYTTFVLQSLWNWFAVPVLHVASVGYWAMFGLNILFGVIFGGNKSREDHFRWEGVLKMLDACVPEEKRVDVQEALKQEAETGIWIDAGSMVFGQVVGNTLTLGIGWAIHSFLV